MKPPTFVWINSENLQDSEVFWSSGNGAEEDDDEVQDHHFVRVEEPLDIPHPHSPQITLKTARFSDILHNFEVWW